MGNGEKSGTKDEVVLVHAVIIRRQSILLVGKLSLTHFGMERVLTGIFTKVIVDFRPIAFKYF